VEGVARGERAAGRPREPSRLGLFVTVAIGGEPEVFTRSGQVHDPVSCQHDVLIQRLEVEADEMASFVQKKANKQWIWIAMDAKTRQIIAFHMGDRSHKSAEQLGARIVHALWLIEADQHRGGSISLRPNVFGVKDRVERLKAKWEKVLWSS